MGPQHPSTHGVLRFRTFTDGELIRKAIPEVGYLHRSIEKIGEMVDYPGFMPYTDRVDYVAAMTANHGYARAVEMLLHLEVPPRAHYLRVIADEMCRIVSHLIAAGTFPMDIGAVTPFVHALREREKLNDLIESLCGARLTYNYVRIGGVAFDMPPDLPERLTKYLDQFEKLMDEFDNLISNNKIFIGRLANLAVISKEQAIAYGLVGPNLRASGVKWDLRKDLPYAVYPELQFDVIVGKGERGTVGDCYDRFIVRIREMRESAKILRQCVQKIPEGPIVGKVPRIIKPPKNEAYGAVEAARGELGYFIVSDGTKNAYRVKIRTGSFAAMSIIESMSNGLMIADLVALVASLDVVAPEIDR
ncbi:MAG TPA: NADH-quinone oxidoreductase subunit D [Bdellovibrionota bacterium]|nr:NADH-quinone oxidoreductase subunit D [Bdellovibrionota bacterium]